MLGGIEQLAIQPPGLAIGAVRCIRYRIPEGVILGRIGQIILVPQPEGVAALQVPEIALTVGKDDSVICDAAQITAEGVFEDASHAALRGSYGQGDSIGFRVIIGLRIPEVALLAEFVGWRDRPVLHLLEMGEVLSPCQHDLLHVFIGLSRGVAGVEEEVLILHLHHGAGAGPAVLTAAAGGLDDGIVVLGVGDEIFRCGQIDGVVVAVAALLEVIDVIGAVLIVGHGVAHIGLIDAIDGGTEEGLVFVGRFLAAGRAQGGKILVLHILGKGFACRLRRFGSRRRGFLAAAARQRQAQNAQQGQYRVDFCFHGYASRYKEQGERESHSPCLCDCNYMTCI